jgi:endonuclease/exonuclease/phosphatase family metal-dependent hydrolase
MRFRLLTYNIHKGIGGVDRRYRPERIIEAIAHCEPDVVLLQEVDEGVPRSRQHRQVDYLGDALGFSHRAYQRNVKLRRGFYGNAILSRFPLYDVRDLELTVPLKKRRRALIAHCRVNIDGHTRTVLVCNVHLGLAGYERAIQLRRFLNCDTLRHAHHRTPAIIAGDFNDVWGRLGRRMLVPFGFRSACGRTRTFPAMMPIRPLDRIYYRGELGSAHHFASHTENARQASDHLPMVADFHLQLPESTPLETEAAVR